MAQKGRGGPRTIYQNCCPGFTPPYWSPKFLWLHVHVCYAGDGFCPAATNSTIAEISESPQMGLLQWQGTIESHGDTLQWFVDQRTDGDVGGVNFDLWLFHDSGGYALLQYHYDQYAFFPGTPAFLVAPVAEDYSLPFIAVTNPAMNMLQWHEVE